MSIFTDWTVWTWLGLITVLAGLVAVHYGVTTERWILVILGIVIAVVGVKAAGDKSSAEAGQAAYEDFVRDLLDDKDGDKDGDDEDDTPDDDFFHELFQRSMREARTEDEEPF